MGFKLAHVDNTLGKKTALGIPQVVYIPQTQAPGTIIKNAAALSASGTLTTFSTYQWPTTTRLVTASFSGNSLSGTITGTNIYGEAMTETFGPIASSTTTNLNKPFLTITSIAYTLSGTTAGRTLQVETSAALAFPILCETSDIFLEYAGDIGTTGGMIIRSAGSVTVTENVAAYTPSLTPGTNVSHVVYLKSTYNGT